MQPTRQNLERMNILRLDASTTFFGTGLASTSRVNGQWDLPSGGQ